MMKQILKKMKEKILTKKKKILEENLPAQNISKLKVIM